MERFAIRNDLKSNEFAQAMKKKKYTHVKSPSVCSKKKKNSKISHLILKMWIYVC